MRALLVINPQATSTTRLRTDVIARAFASELDLKVAETRYRGHAARLAMAAANDGRELVLTLGGDGTVNEVVNGLMRARAPAAGAARHAPPPGHLGPALAALPGGSANVFTRALGLPADPVEAAGHVLEALNQPRRRSVGLGLANDRYFTFNAGVGYDAEVVRAVEGLRAHGRTATPGLYLWTAIRQFYATDRRTPALALERPDGQVTENLFFGIVSNVSPWTYLAHRPVKPSPRASFDTGLDLFAPRRMSTARVLGALRKMLATTGHPGGGQIACLHDAASFALSSRRPIAVQVDGEYVGERERVAFQSVPRALCVVA